MNNSEKNLIGFYRAIGTLPSVRNEETGQYCLISQSNGFWPQLVYNFHFENNSEENLGKLMEEMAHPNSRMLAICNENDFGKFNQDKLREALVFPVETWPTMEISVLPAVKETGDFRFEFRQLINLAELSEFTDLVNTGMMKAIKIADDFFAELALKSHFGFYGLFAENELVSGLVTFTENNIAGLYFIVTKERFRGKGLAEIIIGKTLKLLFEKETVSVVLQAVNKAVPLYNRLGFAPDGKLVILMKY